MPRVYDPKKGNVSQRRDRPFEVASESCSTIFNSCKGLVVRAIGVLNNSAIVMTRTSVQVVGNLLSVK